MDLMTLAAKLTLDAGDYEKGIKKAEGNFSKFGKTLSAKTVALGTFAGNMLTKATTASFKAISNVIKSSTDAYAKFEQLTGGVKTLFGTKEINNAKDYAKQIGLITTKTDKAGKTIEQVNKKMAKSLFGDKTGKATKGMTVEEASQKAFEQAQEAEKTVMDNASKAYKTAGVSMNQYMDTATSLAASMNQSTGGDVLKSAELTDMAIRDMADNANKMGTDMSSVENAYKGFAKGNYTMLDNLKLGYGGTKGEMARLLKDASAITGEKYKMGNMADMVKAINAIQKQQGITGTTEKEAKETIEGSKNMLKASWENVLTALASPEDLDLSGAIASLTDSAKTYLNNLFPVVSEVLSGLGDMMEQILPDIMEKLPELLADFVPKLVKAGEKMLQGLGKGLKKVAAKIKLPEWKDVKATAIKAWDTIKNGAKELGGLIFGKNPDGSIKWPTWNDVKKKAEEAWETIKTGASELGGLIFGKNPDGTIKWPTWDDVKAKAEEAWETIKTGALELGGLVFGKTEDGQVAWPDVTKLVEDFGKWWSETALPALNSVMTWTLTLFGMPEESAEQISSLISGWWDTMVSTAQSVLTWALNLPDTPHEAGKQLGEIIGKWWQGLVSYAEGALQWVLGLFDIGDADGKGTLEMIQGWWDNTVVPLLTDALNFVLGLFGLPSVEEQVKAVADWWEYVKTSIGDALTLAINVLMPDWLKQLLGLNPEQSGEGGKLSKEQETNLREQWDNKENAKREMAGQEGSEAFGAMLDSEFADALAEKMRASGASDEDVASALEQLESVDSSNIDAFLDSLTQVGEEGTTAGEDVKGGMDMAGSSANSATTSVESLGEAIAAVAGTHEIKFKITTEGEIPDLGGDGGDGEHAKGLPTVPFDNYIAQLHRGEMVLTKSQARQYREGSSGGFDPTAMAASIVAAVREGMAGASVNSFIDGKPTTDNVNRRTSNKLRARRFATV